MHIYLKLYLYFFIKVLIFKFTDWETRTFRDKRWLTIPESERCIPLEEGLELVKR